jgi:hypothetical protein
MDGYVGGSSQPYVEPNAPSITSSSQSSRDDLRGSMEKMSLNNSSKDKPEKKEKKSWFGKRK